MLITGMSTNVSVSRCENDFEALIECREFERFDVIVFLMHTVCENALDSRKSRNSFVTSAKRNQS